MKYINSYTIMFAVLIILSFTSYFMADRFTFLMAVVCNVCFSYFTFENIKNIYLWNDGICQKTGNPWIAEGGFPDYGLNFSSTKGNIRKEINLQCFKPSYNHTQAKIFYSNA